MKEPMKTIAAYAGVLSMGLLSLGFTPPQTKDTGEATRKAATPEVDPPAERSGSSRGMLSSEVSREEGMDLYRQERYREAAAVFAARLDSARGTAEDRYMCALSYWKSGQLEKAEERFRTLVIEYPGHERAHFNFARVHMEAGNPGKALTLLERVHEPEAQGEYHRLLGRAYHNLGRTEDAVQAYHRAILINDRDVWAMNNLGLIHIQEGRYEEALASLARAHEVRSDLPVVERNLRAAKARFGSSQTLDLAEWADRFENTVESWRKEADMTADNAPRNPDEN